MDQTTARRISANFNQAGGGIHVATTMAHYHSRWAADSPDNDWIVMREDGLIAVGLDGEPIRPEAAQTMRDTALLEFFSAQGA